MKWDYSMGRATGTLDFLNPFAPIKSEGKARMLSRAGASGSCIIAFAHALTAFLWWVDPPLRPAPLGLAASQLALISLIGMFTALLLASIIDRKQPRWAAVAFAIWAAIEASHFIPRLYGHAMWGALVPIVVICAIQCLRGSWALHRYQLHARDAENAFS
jgi:hypothetical protein